jgi:hypothetical protein
MEFKSIRCNTNVLVNCNSRKTHACLTIDAQSQVVIVSLLHSRKDETMMHVLQTRPRQEDVQFRTKAWPPIACCPLASFLLLFPGTDAAHWSPSTAPGAQCSQGHRVVAESLKCLNTGHIAEVLPAQDPY